MSRDFFCEEIFSHKNKASKYYPVELHWDLHSFSGISCKSKVEDFFSRARAVSIKASNFTFAALHPVDALIHAALHLTLVHGQDMQLRWIYDISFLSRKLVVPDDWIILQARSVEWRAVLAMQNSLKMARIWTGLKLPVGFDDFSKWPDPAQIEIKAWSHAIRPYHNIISFFKLSLTDSSNISEKVGSIFHLIFPEPGIVRMNYPPLHRWLLPLSYIQRWWRWLMASMKFEVRNH